MWAYMFTGVIADNKTEVTMTLTGKDSDGNDIGPISITFKCV
jgi:hypothetical protein